MARKKPETIEIEQYYNALRNEFLLGAKRSTALPHLGERGRNEEERVREFLRRVLPKRFSVGSGFVISSKKDLGVSPQMDVIIFDEIHNAPVFREISADVFPVEMVYAVVEVKRVLRKKDLPKILKDIQHIRTLGDERWYVTYRSVPRPENPDERITGAREIPVQNPKPRSYVVAFGQKDWTDHHALAKDLISALEATPTHIHGMVVLDPDWYLTLEAYSDPKVGLKAEVGDSLLRFVHNVLHSVASMPMQSASIDRYLAAATPNQPLQRTRRKRRAAEG
jgi:hypothetical protein